MARILTLTSPPSRTDALLADLRALPDLLQLQLQRGASLQPPGDVIGMVVPNRQLNRLMRLLDQHALARPGGIAMTSADPASVVPTERHACIERDSNEAAWEEMEMTIADDTNASVNTLLTMAVAGALAIIGIATHALHIVIGGMLVAPGFMPLVRMALGRVNARGLNRYALLDFGKGYLALMAGAVACAGVLWLIGVDPLRPQPSYHAPAQSLVDYWTTMRWPRSPASSRLPAGRRCDSAWTRAWSSRCRGWCWRSIAASCTDATCAFSRTVARNRPRQG